MGGILPQYVCISNHYSVHFKLSQNFVRSFWINWRKKKKVLNRNNFDFAMVQGTAAAKSLQSCPTLCDPIDGSPPGSPIPGIFQARTLEWVAISVSNAWKWKVKVKLLSLVRLLATPWTAVHQAPPSMGFSRQEYWSGVPLPSPSKALKTSITKDCCGHIKKYADALKTPAWTEQDFNHLCYLPAVNILNFVFVISLWIDRLR